MRVAVIGGLGFIGQEFSKCALEAGHEVDVYDLAVTASIDDERWSYHQIDLSGEVPASLGQADAMVLLAAIRPYNGFSYADYEKNVRIAIQGFTFARESGIRNVVFASSKAVYSDPTSMPWSEDLYPAPLSLYGASKVAVEQIASFLNSKQDMAIKSLRFAQVIGMGERKGYLINTLIDNAIAGKQQVVYGDGSQRRQYVYVKDVCGAILAALGKPDIGGVFNIGMKGAVSNLELAECVNKVFGNDGNLACDSAKPMGDVCDEMNVSKAEMILGFKARYDLKGLFTDIAQADFGQGS